MSRSDYAQTLSFDKCRTHAARSCMLLFALSAGCRFSTNPGDSIVVADAGEHDASASSATEEEAPPAITRTSTGTKTASTLDAAIATDADDDPDDRAHAATSDAGEPAAAAPTAASTAEAGSSAPAQPATTAGTSAPALPTAGASAPATASPPPAAGSFATPTHSPKEAVCSAELANCLLRDPLAYAECLRTNQDNGCPDPNAGVPTTSPVTTKDGKPLSQACQAELASCIARLPTPENAASCTEKARTCN